MRALLDVNVLLALFDPGHLFHQRARAWWHANRDGGWASCPLTENGYLRIVSQKSYARAVRLPDALKLFRNWAVPPLHEFWPDDVSLIDATRFEYGHLLGPKQVHGLLVGLAEILLRSELLARRLEQFSENRSSHVWQVLRQTSPVVDKKHPRMFTQIRTDSERTELCLLPFRRLACGHARNFALSVEGVDVHVEIPDRSPFSGSFVRLA